MNTSNEKAMRLALEALESTHDVGCNKTDEAITSLRQAIAEAEKQSTQCVEPVLIVEKEPDYMSGGHFHTGTKPHIDPTKVWSLPIGTKLYTTPYVPTGRQQRKPLTEEQIRTQFCGKPENFWDYYAGVRYAEAAHGIKE